MEISMVDASSHRNKKKKSLQRKKRKVGKDAKASNTTDSNDESKLRGLKKWLWEYRAKRPGLDALQNQVDKFIAEYEAGEEQAQKTREAAAANDEGWTLVVHKGGRKKVTASESGIKVGAVAVPKAEKQGKQKASKEQIALNFYKFQRRDARRNEVLELQRRFEEDKKRIAKMRAARKFCPF